MMAGIRGLNTKPELRLRQALHARGFRFRLHAAELPGRPDIVLPRWRVVIQVHGCFWHRHAGCRLTTNPSHRQEFWEAKFAETVRRDLRQLKALSEAGWRVATVWECGLRGRSIDQLVDRLDEWIRARCGEVIDLPSS